MPWWLWTCSIFIQLSKLLISRYQCYMLTGCWKLAVWACHPKMLIIRFLPDSSMAATNWYWNTKIKFVFCFHTVLIHRIFTQSSEQEAKKKSFVTCKPMEISLSNFNMAGNEKSRGKHMNVQLCRSFMFRHQSIGSIEIIRQNITYPQMMNKHNHAEIGCILLIFYLLYYLDVELQVSERDSHRYSYLAHCQNSNRATTICY